MRAFAQATRSAFEQLVRAPPRGAVPLRAPPARARRCRSGRRGVPGHLAARGACARALGAAGRDAFAPGCSRWPTTARSTCCAAAAAKSRSALDDDEREPWQPRRRGLAALAGAPASAAQRRGPVFWRARRRQAARLPGAPARRAAQRLPAAPRGRPRARRAGARARGRLRDRQEPPALRDGQAAHLHGRLPAAGARNA